MIEVWTTEAMRVENGRGNFFAGAALFLLYRVTAIQALRDEYKKKKAINTALQIFMKNF